MLFDLLTRILSIGISITIVCIVVMSFVYYWRFKAASRRPIEKLSRASASSPSPASPAQKSPAGVA